ncbi:conserved hypothetical protein [Azospirillaceae bacterium]
MPKVNTNTMSSFLEAFSKNIESDVHILLVMDQAGWHRSKKLSIPNNITVVSLPPYSPELNPVERVWLYLRERFLSHRLLDDYNAIVDACCEAWNTLTADRETLRSLVMYPWMTWVNK